MIKVTGLKFTPIHDFRPQLAPPYTLTGKDKDQRYITNELILGDGSLKEKDFPSNKSSQSPPSQTNSPLNPPSSTLPSQTFNAFGNEIPIGINVGNARSTTTRVGEISQQVKNETIPSGFTLGDPDNLQYKLYKYKIENNL